MKNLTLISLFLILNVSLAAQSADLNRPAYVPGEVIIKYKSGGVGLRSGMDKMNKDAGKTLHVKTESGKGVLETVQRLRHDPQIEFVQPNFIKYAHKIPNDPDFGQLWGMLNTGQTVLDQDRDVNNPGTAGADMGVTEAWDISTDCSDVIIAVLDSGVAYTHPDLRDNMWDGSGGCVDPDNSPIPGGCPKHGYDFIDYDTDPFDLFGHGTHVSGTIGARGDNGLAVAGVCWRAQIMAVRVLGDDGKGQTLNIADGIRFAVNNGAKIINMSLSGVGDDEIERAALAYAREQGVLIVLSAGNDHGEVGIGEGRSTSCVNDLDNVLCVGALGQKFDLTSFSNFSKTYVDTAAPGQNVLSAYIGPNYLESYKTGDVLNWTRVSGIDWIFASGEGRTSVTLKGETPAELGGVHRIYGTIDQNDMQAGGLTFRFIARLDDVGDSFSIYTKTGAGEPFTTGSRVYHRAPPYVRDLDRVSTDLAGCDGTICSIGIEFVSVPDESSGVGVLVDSLAYITTHGDGQYKVASGTSMSAPMVAGLAGLIWHYNPNFTYQDVKRVIENSGRPLDSLKDKTSSGKAANAVNALKFIGAPKGVSVVLE